MTTNTAAAVRPVRAHDTEWSRWRGAMDLSGRAFDQLTTRAHEWHRAISDLPFSGLQHVPGLREGAAPTRLIHDSITDGVYAAVRLSGAALFGGITQVMKAIERSALAPQTLTTRSVNGTRLVSAISGLVGDDMATRRNPLAPRLGFYRDNARLALTPHSLAGAFPQATSKLVVFVHGLCCDEHVWSMYRDQAPASAPDYASCFAARGYTPLFLRYNSGLHISQNGRGFSRVLERLVANWPIPVTEIVLVGPSMGGLVARAAAHSGALHEAQWVRHVTRVFCIGTPHLGAPLEQVVNIGVEKMERYALTRPLARILKIRSAGIKDLRHGATHDRDWRGRDLNALGEATREQIGRIAGARYHFIGSTLGSALDDHLSRTIGDGLVNFPSSVAHELADADSATLTRLHHVRLVNHPQVWDWIEERLGRPAAAT